MILNNVPLRRLKTFQTYKQVVDPAVKAISVTAPLSFEPEELILLVHGQAPIKVICLSRNIVRLLKISVFILRRQIL